MKQVLQDQLIEKFPNLYKNKFGFECGDGWYGIIWNLSNVLTGLNPEVRATQVKEKLGGLRFYIDQGGPDVYAAIVRAYAQSYKTCESCGEKGRMHIFKDGWIKTQCDDCQEERTRDASSDD